MNCTVHARRRPPPPLPPPAGPTNLIAQAVAPLEVRLSWLHAGAPSDTRYQIERSDGAGRWRRVGTAHAGWPRFADPGRTPSTAYTYRVRAVNSGGTSSYTNSASATTVAEDGAGEFVGPLGGWKNLVTDFGAVGDGVADCTAAVQAAANALLTHSGFAVVYVPAGAYRLTDTITTTRAGQTDSQGTLFVGEDPATTSFVWEGAADRPMFFLDSWYSALRRFTFDGDNKIGAGFATLQYGQNFSSYTEVADCVFKDTPVGLQLGDGGGSGQAEMQVLRCHFQSCSERGISTSNANSLDIWAWYCHFEDCGYGIKCGSGAAYPFHCLFERSAIADFSNNNLEHFSLVGNVSSGSAAFMTTGPQCATVVTGNRILNCTGDTVFNFTAHGPNYCADNIVLAAPGKTAPLAGMGGEQIFAGNLYSLAGAVTTNGSYQLLDEEVVSGASIDPTLPYLPGAPPRRIPGVDRTVFEITAGSSAATIQAAIDSAAMLAGQRPVIHLQPGNCNIATTLSVPANCDMQIIGDGVEVASRLSWTGAGSGPVIHVQGPTQASFRDFFIVAPAGHGIVIDKADQAGAQIHGSQMSFNGESGRADYGAYINGIENADVTLLCQQGDACGEWIRVQGSAAQNAGTLTPGQIGVFCGASNAMDYQYRCENGGRLIVRNLYHEVGGGETTALDITGHGSMHIDGTRFSYACVDANPVLRVTGGSGDLAVLGSEIYSFSPTTVPRVAMSGNGGAMRSLVACNRFRSEQMVQIDADDVWFDTTKPAGTCGFTQNLDWISSHASALADRGAVTDAHLRALLAPLRSARISLPRAPKMGVTSILFHRVRCRVGPGFTNLRINA